MTTTADPDERFSFGENWRSFLAEVDEPRISAAETSLAAMLKVRDLRGRSFLDIGSGSGLFSLAARRLGATVRSFDYDTDSVACTSALRDRFRPGDEEWRVERGSVLDAEYMASLGTYDVVYSWGVLHHTGNLWEAVANATARVARGGSLFIAIYNDQGRMSDIWTAVKRRYVGGGRLTKGALVAGAGALFGARFAIRRFTRWSIVDHYSTDAPAARGMTRWHDLVDWVGGYPFEVATPGEVVDFCGTSGFRLVTLRTVGGGHGCNEFVLRRTHDET